MAEALWQLVGRDLLDYCIIIQWAHHSNQPMTLTQRGACSLGGVPTVTRLPLEAGEWVRTVVKSYQLNVRFMRGNWPEASWMRGQLKAHNTELCHRLSTGEPGWMRLIAGELYSSQSCRVLAVNAARTHWKSAVLRLFFFFLLKQERDYPLHRVWQRLKETIENTWIINRLDLRV